MSWRTLWAANVVPLVPHCQWMAPVPTFLVTLFGPKLFELLGATVIVVVARPDASAGIASKAAACRSVDTASSQLPRESVQRSLQAARWPAGTIAA